MKKEAILRLSLLHLTPGNTILGFGTWGGNDLPGYIGDCGPFLKSISCNLGQPAGATASHHLQCNVGNWTAHSPISKNSCVVHRRLGWEDQE